MSQAMGVRVNSTYGDVALDFNAFDLNIRYKNNDASPNNYTNSVPFFANEGQLSVGSIFAINKSSFSFTNEFSPSEIFFEWVQFYLTSAMHISGNINGMPHSVTIFSSNTVGVDDWVEIATFNLLWLNPTSALYSTIQGHSLSWNSGVGALVSDLSTLIWNAPSFSDININDSVTIIETYPIDRHPDAININNSVSVSDSFEIPRPVIVWNNLVTIQENWKIIDRNTTAVAYSLKSSAITELSNMRFDGSVQFAGKTLFFNEQGLFEYTGTVDDGNKSIPLSLKTGALNFGTQHLKLIPTSKVYVMANKQDGDLGLNVTVDDVTYGYLNSLQYDHFKTYRFGIGRGLRGNYWQFEILADGVGRLMIDSVELEPEEIRRRA